MLFLTYHMDHIIRGIFFAMAEGGDLSTIHNLRTAATLKYRLRNVESFTTTYEEEVTLHMR